MEYYLFLHITLMDILFTAPILSFLHSNEGTEVSYLLPDLYISLILVIFLLTPAHTSTNGHMVSASPRIFHTSAKLIARSFCPTIIYSVH